MPSIMRLILVSLIPLSHLAFASVIPTKLARFSTAVTASLPQLHSLPFIGELVKKDVTPQCFGVRVKQDICTRNPDPHGSVTLDTSPLPDPDCFRDTICCGTACDGLDIIGPVAKRHVIDTQLNDTVMTEPNMKPLVKRQDGPIQIPDAGPDVVVYENGQLLDSKYADFFTCKPPGGSTSNPSPGREAAFSIGYYRIGDNQYQRAVFNGGGIDVRDACQNPKPLFRDQEKTKGERPTYPEKVRFDAEVRKNCEFNRLGDSEAGGLTCDGVLAKCNKVSGDPEPVECKDGGKTREVWRTQVLCLF